MTLKRFIGVLMIYLNVLSASGQTHQVNHGKYWYYRYRLKQHFMKPGLGQGEGLIANQRGRPVSDAGNTYSALSFGDQTINLGYYMAILAMEYNLLAYNDQPADSTVRDLFQTLWAFNRLDLHAESAYRKGFQRNPVPKPLPEDLNGFFIRDDVDRDFLQDPTTWAHFTRDQLPSQAQLNPDHLQSDWSTVQNATMKKPSDFQAAQVSQDQVYYIIMGIAFIRKFIPPGLRCDTLVFQDGEADIRKESENILRRIIGYANASNRNGSPWDTWRLKTPFLGDEPFSERVNAGFNMGLWSYGTAAACLDMLGKNKSTLDTSGARIHNHFSRGNYFLWTMQRLTGFPYALPTRDNSHMFGLLLALNDVSNLWPFHWIGYRSKQLHHVPLIKQVLYGGPNPVRVGYYTKLLNAAPPQGPYNFVWNPDSTDHNAAHYEWSTSDRFIHPERLGKPANFKGEYPGLDYMLYHNLFYTAHRRHYKNPVYSEPVIIPVPE